MLAIYKLFLYTCKKKISDIVDNEVVKNTKFKTIKAKVNNLEKKFPDSKTLIHINQYNTDQQNFEKKKLEILIDNTNPQYTINNTKGLATRTVMKTKISLIKNKIPDDSS